MPGARVAVSAVGSRAGGLVALQALVSVSSLAQVLVFAALLTPREFDGYAVWVTAVLFLVGLAQCVGAERVLIGRMGRDDGRAAATVLALVVMLAAVAVALWLGSATLAVAGVATYGVTLWDHLRVVDGLERPWPFARVDAAVLAGQVAVVIALDAAGAPSAALPVAWWVLGCAVWLPLAARVVRPGLRRLRRGVGVLRADGREAAPLLVDAALAGLPLVVALALVRDLGEPGAASSARIAVSLMGPVLAIGIVVRRVVFSRLAAGSFDRRARTTYAVAVVAAFAACFVLLALTRTPAYAALFPGLGALSWATILWFCLDRPSLIASVLPAGVLRRRRRTGLVALARVLATALAGLTILALMPLTTTDDVARTSATASLSFALLTATFAGLVARVGLRNDGRAEVVDAAVPRS